MKDRHSVTNGTVTALVNGSDLTLKEGNGSEMLFYWRCSNENMRRFGVKLLTRGGSACLNRARQCRMRFLAGGFAVESLDTGLGNQL